MQRVPVLQRQQPPTGSLLANLQKLQQRHLQRWRACRDYLGLGMIAAH
jgi:hypothetical protein